MILVKPYLGCPLRCEYCYQSDLRGDNNPFTKLNYDLDAILHTMDVLYKEQKQSISLHGGEPLAMPIEDLEALFKKSAELQGHGGIQTSGFNINDDIIALFKKYKVSVGLSIDGPYPLNEFRGFPNNVEKTKRYTNQVLKNIEAMCAEGVYPGLIIVLHKANAVGDRLEKLKEFITWLKGVGVKSGKLNPCSVFNPSKRDKIELTSEELTHAWLELAKFTMPDPELRWDPFRAMVKNLRGSYLSDCIFTKCDFWNTQAGRVILGDGSVSCCARTFEIVGTTFIRPGRISFERYDALEQTDCNNCRYWNVCFGGCPGNGRDGDWRNKDKHCASISALYEHLEKQIKSVDPTAILVTDKEYKDQKGEHLRHSDSAHGDSEHGDGIEHRDSGGGHGDIPHGDEVRHEDT